MGERFIVSPWLTDEPGERRIAFAGFMSTNQKSQDEMDKLKTELTSKIRYLGGVVVEGDGWTADITHVVVYNDPHKEGLTEKVMAGIAAGRWVLTKVCFVL